MNILHIAEHLGDGAGKAIGGLARMGNNGGNRHQILLLDEPRKLNHVNRCRDAGVDILTRDAAKEAIEAADVVILNWWGGIHTDTFLEEFPEVPCRMLLWSHKNGYFDPPLSDALVDVCNGLLATTPWTLENPHWQENGTLVWGFGDFKPHALTPKTDYSLKDKFVIGCTGTPGYKKLPRNFLDYCKSVTERIPNAYFILAGETSEELKNDIVRSGMESRFALTGWVSGVNALLRTFDVFGYLLRSDTFATTENAVLEAMAAALPVVVSKSPLGKYLLEDGSSGFLADNPEEYGRIMENLYNDKGLRTRAGVAAREYAINVYCAEENLRRFNDACVAIMATQKMVRVFKECIR
jgi:hypothetical protein